MKVDTGFSNCQGALNHADIIWYGDVNENGVGDQESNLRDIILRTSKNKVDSINADYREFRARTN